jgi:hypothetical protein
VVRFVSQPKRAGRALYELATMPGIWLTATHPILQGVDANNYPVLGFVDLILALRTNPLWGSFHIVHLPVSSLTQKAGTALSSEVLYDLVLDNTAGHAGTSTHSLQTSSGITTTVLSEAPDIAALPSTTRFVLALVTQLG